MGNPKNPYTTEEISDEIKNKVINKIQLLKNNNTYKDIDDTYFKDRKSTIKQKAVDLFSDIELNGYPCHLDWFMKLSGRRLKELYKQLEDLWNYRLNNYEDTKILLSPPDGKLFTTPIQDVNNYDSLEDLQELILHDVSKFKDIENNSNKKLGYMYFIICLSFVCHECWSIHQDWLVYAITNV